MVDSGNVLILADRGVTVEEIYEQQVISVGTAHKIVHDDLAFLGSFVIEFHQDNARTVKTINQFGWKQLPYPPYSSDLAPTHFHLFGPLKEFQHGTKFLSNDKVKNTMSKWLKTQFKGFNDEEMPNLVF